jgi:outer membrane protein OmpA-like peptidoglycan-associated protein
MTSHRSSWFSAISLLTVMLILPMSLLAQDKVDKAMEKASLAFRQNQLVDAEDLYQEVLAIDPDNYQATYRIGQIKRAFQDYREALRYFRKAAEIDSSRNDTVYLLMGLTYKILDNCRKAEEAFEIFIKRHGANDLYGRRAQLEIEGCALAEEQMNARPSYRVKPTTFNSTADDMVPSLLDQQQEDVFISFMSSRVPPGERAKKRDQVTGQPSDRNLYYVVKENDSTFGAELQYFPKRINHKKRPDGPATFTGDGLTMYFVRCNTKENREGCSIFESKYDPIKKEWGKPIFVEALSGEKEAVTSRGKTQTVPTDDTQPFVTPDGRTIFFVSDRPGGEGGYDIWYARRVGAGWSTPQNLGPSINTPFNEATPFYNQEDQILYFASTGYPSLGGYDLYETKGTIDNWGPVENEGFPLNTTYDEFGGIWMNEGDSLAYFTSNRPGGVGGYDIYYGQKYAIKLSKLELAVKGTIRNKETQEPVPFATAILFEYQANNRIVPLDTFKTDQSARYNFPLKADRRYKVLGNAPDYLANEEDVSTMNIRTNKTLVQNIDIELEPIVIGKEITLNNIYYDFDEYYLRPDALAELRDLLKILNQNPNIVIQLGSHTDSNGTIYYNRGLSENRAKAVVKYLARNGISPSRLNWFGYGETDPLIFPETSDFDEQSNRRTEFRITSIDFQ